MIVIDPEFQQLIPPLKEDELEQLEASLLADGCRDALVVWKDHNTLVDGHNRYAICTKHNIPYTTIERPFAGRADVAEWMLRNQLGRRNLTDAARIRAARRFKELLAKEAQERQIQGLKQGDEKPVVSNLTQREMGKTRDKLAEMSSVSAGKFTQGEKVIDAAPQNLQQKWDAGDISTYRAYELTRALEKLPTPDHERIVDMVDDSVEKTRILHRLYQSNDNDGSNSTYTEIITTGGFHYGDDMDEWCDFKASSVQAVQRSLDSLAKYHKLLAMEQAKAEQETERAKKAKAFIQTKGALSDYVHGNCLHVLPTLPPQSVRLLLTDPPYGIAFQSNRRTASAQADAIPSDATPEEAIALLADMLKAIDHAMMDDSRVLIYTSQRYHADFSDVVANAGYTIGRTLTWVKENHTSGNLSDFAPQTEWIINAWRGSPSMSHRISEVLQFKREYTTSHPTEKPVMLQAELIKVLTIPDELIVDPFAGTGSTVVAARRLKRRALGIELTKEWYNEGVVRLEE